MGRPLERAAFFQRARRLPLWVRIKGAFGMKFNTGEADEKLPRYNHYVPRFILDNFALNGQLSIFDKHTLKRFRLPPYRAMGEKDFNNVRVGADILSFENKFTF